MFLRNLMSMDTEEMIRAQPVDACIMIGGKSKDKCMESTQDTDYHHRVRQDCPCTNHGWNIR